MTQIPNTDSVSAYRSTAQPTDFDTCPVGGGGGGWKQSRNASIGDQWGDCPWGYNGTTNTVNRGWDDRTNVDKFSHQSAMGSLDYGVPVFQSNGASPPWMTEGQSEGPSPRDKSHPASESSVDKWADSNPTQTVPIFESNSAIPSPTIVCECTVIYPPAENQPTERTESGWGSILGPIAVVVAVVALPCTVYKAHQDSGPTSKYDGLTQLDNIYATPKWQRAITKASSACAGKVRRTLGFKEKEGDDWKHPLYDTEVSKGDDEQRKTGRSASSSTPKPFVNKSHLGSTKRARRPYDRRSYVPHE